MFVTMNLNCFLLFPVLGFFYYWLYQGYKKIPPRHPVRENKILAFLAAFLGVGIVFLGTFYFSLLTQDFFPDPELTIFTLLFVITNSLTAIMTGMVISLIYFQLISE